VIKEIPADLKEVAEHWRHQMIEAAAEFDDELMEAYIHNQPITEVMIGRAIRKGTVEGKLHPVLVGAAHCGTSAFAVCWMRLWTICPRRWICRR
jgi:elongation factor G